MPGPLASVRVLDLTTTILGPWAMQILGDMGADVIKVESPQGDMTRALGWARHDGMGALFLNTNRNKRGIALDLKQAQARAALLRLARSADVFVHAMRPAAIGRLRLAYADVAAVNPAIVYCAAYGYGEGGPYSGRTAYDDMIQGAAGIAELMGRRTGEPAYVPTVIADKTVALAMAGSIAMALFHRERTGEGQEITVPMFETMTAFVMVEHLNGRTFEPALGSTGYARTLSPSRKPYRTLDGYIGVIPYSDRQWTEFFKLIGRPDLERDERFRTLKARAENVDVLYAELARVIATRSSGEWLAALDAASIPATPINGLDDLLDDPHLAAVGFWKPFDHPSEGRLATTSVISSFSLTPGAIRRGAPRLGEHTAEVLREGGLDEAEIEALLASGAAVQAYTNERSR